MSISALLNYRKPNLSLKTFPVTYALLSAGCSNLQQLDGPGSSAMRTLDPEAARLVDQGDVARNQGSIDAALQLYSKAAQSHSIAGLGAFTKIGMIYEHDGTQNPQNYAVAMAWFRKSADEGYPLGDLLIGDLYAKGLGVPQNLQQAYSWISAAAASDPFKERDLTYRYAESWIYLYQHNQLPLNPGVFVDGQDVIALASLAQNSPPSIVAPSQSSPPLHTDVTPESQPAPQHQGEAMADRFEQTLAKHAGFILLFAYPAGTLDRESHDIESSDESSAIIKGDFYWHGYDGKDHETVFIFNIFYNKNELYKVSVNVEDQGDTFAPPFYFAEAAKQAILTYAGDKAKNSIGKMAIAVLNNTTSAKDGLCEFLKFSVNNTDNATD